MIINITKLFLNNKSLINYNPKEDSTGYSNKIESTSSINSNYYINLDTSYEINNVEKKEIKNL